MRVSKRMNSTSVKVEEHELQNKQRGLKSIKKESISSGDFKFDEDKKFQSKDISSEEEDLASSDSNSLKEWWEQENLQISAKGERRWETLSHNGVLFPPPYKPHGVPIMYDGVEFHLTSEEEEIATMFAVMKTHDYYRNKVFRSNFFRSWREVLDRRNHPIKILELCNFDRIYQWYQNEQQIKLKRTKEEKKELKIIADNEAEPYRWCYWNGKKELVANFRVEPPGLFRGRGKHPKMGVLKTRVMPEDITINIGEGEPIPVPPNGHHWKEIIHNHNVTWLAMWTDSVLGNSKYVMMAPSSTIKGMSDYHKFEKSRELKNHINFIRESYNLDFKSSNDHIAQRAVAMYFIDRLALRIGNEKGSDEADTVGCCSLRVEHLKLLPNDIVKFDFLGKDSIRYQNEVKVLSEVYCLLYRFIAGKQADDEVFDQLTPTQLNDHLKSFMPGLSAKVFRTYNASFCLEKWFVDKPISPNSSLADKLAYFNRANKEVAILCNHQKTVAKSFNATMGNLQLKAAYTQGRLDRLIKAAATLEKGGISEAASEYFSEEDRIQREWLDKYGTPEQVLQFTEIVEKRKIPGSIKKSLHKEESKKSSKIKSKKSLSKKSKSSKKQKVSKSFQKREKQKKEGKKNLTKVKKLIIKKVKKQPSIDEEVLISSL